MRIPKYRVRRDRDSAYVEMDGERVSLPGRANSPESKDAYRHALNDYLRRHASKAKPEPARPVWSITIEDVVDKWLDHCKIYYGTSNTRSSEYSNCRYAVHPLVALYGRLPVVDFRIDEMRDLREAMIRGSWTTPKAKQAIKPWSRRHANAQINKIKRMLHWGVEQGMVPAENEAVIAALSPLEKGRTFAKERPPVVSVTESAVDATLPHLPPEVADMVNLQRLTGMRSDNLCSMRPCDIDQSGEVWVYRPAEHKEGHRGQELAVPLGPRCQEILKRHLNQPPGAISDLPCFCPRKSSRRSTGKRAPGLRYTTGTYRNAIRRAIQKANKKTAKEAAERGKPAPPPIPHWHPHQLRHAAANAAKRSRGLDGARAYLGHAMVKTTEIYEERDLALAVEIAREIG